jgi:hypothetical protein
VVLMVTGPRRRGGSALGAFGHDDAHGIAREVFDGHRHTTRHTAMGSERGRCSSTRNQRESISMFHGGAANPRPQPGGQWAGK